ncbi:B-cell lymphoma 3 protein-like [Haliotis rufescens]|uniref:B-cell lymphoma 3 protein-like n=1 Tax=Haliotis rufescens TaxID=6454 RepID=UPI00201FAFF7|nr:B-cell lymphoma 3 protein-like [Haliotis rufescens]
MTVELCQLYCIQKYYSFFGLEDGKSGRTPMFHAAENNEIDMVEMLLKRGANPDVLNYAGSTAIMAAQARNFSLITKMLSRASEWNDEEGSGTSSPASKVSVYLPDPAVGVWNHAVPLRNPATKQKGTAQTAPVATFVRASSSLAADNEVSLTQSSAVKPPETVPRVTVGNSIMDKTAVVMEKRPSSFVSRTASRSPEFNSVVADEFKGKD